MTSPAPAPLADATWKERQERSNQVLLRLMTALSLASGRRASRWVLHLIAAYFTLFAPAARRASRRYLARALGRPPRLADVYRHVLAFASTIHDRIYLLNGRWSEFDIEVEGQEAIHAACADGRGLLLMGAHLGSFEVMRCLGRSQGGFAVSMLMYEENARKINAALAAINPAAVQDIIPLGRMESMIQAQARIEEGHLVGMLADRSIGGDPARLIDFLGAPAAFPLGPWRMAAMLRRPVLLMTGLYLGGRRYHVQFELLADFSRVERTGRDAAMEAAQRRYVQRLEHYCRQAPYNWFNFFDFWHQP
ncbi:MAG TPA: acyl-CoA synthetase [Azospira sp.]|nr:acyl-CoA synthetase [Azospira sp.]